MHGLIVDIGTDTCGQIEIVFRRFRNASEVLLFVHDVVLCGGNYTIVLNPTYVRTNEFPRKVRIWAESLRSTASLGKNAHRSNGRTQKDVSSYVAELLTHACTMCVSESPIPGCCNILSCWPSCGKVDNAGIEWNVLCTQPRKA